MVIRRTLVVIFLLCLGIAGFSQQRALTSMYQYNLLPLNPAYAGSLNIMSAIAMHRKQWINVEGAPQFSSLSAHTSLMQNRIGVGFFLGNDQIGVTDDLSFYGSYAYKIRTSLGILAMGISGGFNNRKSNYSELELLDKSDPFLSGRVSRFAPNFGTGIYFANPVFYAGFSVPYILENKTLEIAEISTSNEESRESRNYYFQSGIILPLAPNIKLSPAILLRGQEDSRFEWDISTNVIFDEIAYVGINVRNNGELTFMGQVILNENFRVGYAYDATTNALGNNSAGSHEILLNYRIKLRNYKKDPQCPVYF